MALIQLKHYSAALKVRTDVNVIIPTAMPAPDGLCRRNHEFQEFYKTQGNYPVLYLLHGTYGDAGDWLRFSRINDYARRYNLVVVMPGGENSCYRDTKSGKDYEVYITQELPQMIQWMFPVSGKRKDTFICGLSMGGGAAVRLGLTHQDIYGCTIGLSADLGSTTQIVNHNNFTVWSWAFDGQKDYGNTAFDPEWLADQAKAYSGEQTKLYLACGTEDILHNDNIRFHEYLDKIGLEHVYSTGAGAHNWDFWDPEMLKVLEWLPIQTRNLEAITLNNEEK